jgi:arginine decarboxylase
MIEALTRASTGQPSRGWPEGGPRISLCSGFGTGPTGLAAFDAALREAGIANFNLILLSSVIPAGSELVDANTAADRPSPPIGDWGDRLYVVLADERVDRVGDEAWAGIGWVQAADGRGLFVEHHGTADRDVRNDIEASLQSLVAGRNEAFSPPQMRLRGGVCAGQPACSLVAAVYDAEGWDSAAGM